MAVVQSQGQIRRLETSREANWWPTSNLGSLTLYGDLTQDYAAIYRTQPNVRTVVSFLARNIAQLGLKVYRRVSNEEREQLNDHPLAKTIRKPNPFTTRYRLLDSLVTDLGVYDNAFWLKVRGEENQVNLLRMPPQYVDEVGNNRFKPTEYMLFGVEDLTYPAEEVVHFRGHNPDNPKWGLSPLEALRRILAEEQAAGEYREYHWRNHSRAEVALRHPGTLSDAAQNRLRAQWEALYTGAAASGRTAVLEEGMEIENISVTAKDSQYVEARKLTREEVASAYHISPAMVGILEHANFANIKEQHKMLYQDSLGPWLVMIEEDIELQLLPEFPDSEGIYTEFNIAEKLKGDFDEQASSAQASVGAPWLTRNEQRARMNLKPVEGGDQLVTPLNVLIGGLASPQDADPNKPDMGTPAKPGAAADDISKLVAAATALVRAGFDPGESLEAVGLDPIEHLGLLPITLQGQEEPPPAEPPPPKSGAKARSDVQRRQGHIAKHEQELKRFYTSRRDAVLSRMGAKSFKAVSDLVPLSRWNSELRAIMFALSMQTANDFGKQVAGDDYDPDLALEFVEESSRIAAEGMNEDVKGAIAKALKDENPVDAVKHAFDVVLTASVPRAAVTRVTAMSSFGKHEGAKQAGMRTKTWLVTSKNPRSSHARMNGETVKVSETFSNGGLWPGDSALGPEEVANCSCTVDFGGRE